MSNFIQRMLALGFRTMSETKGEWQRENIPDAEDRIVAVMSRFILDNDLPDLILDEGAHCRERAAAVINKIDLIVKDDRIPSMDDLEELRLIVANIRAVQEHVGSNLAYEEAQQLVRDLNRYRNFRYDTEVAA